MCILKSLNFIKQVNSSVLSFPTIYTMKSIPLFIIHLIAKAHMLSCSYLDGSFNFWTYSFSLNSQTKNYNTSSQFILIMPLKGLQREIFSLWPPLKTLNYFYLFFMQSTHVYKYLFFLDLFQNTVEMKVMTLTCG